MNPIKKAGVKIMLDKERIISFDFNALVDIEEKYGSLDKGLGRLENPKMKDIRYLLYLTLKGDDETLTEKKVGQLITLQNMNEVIDALSKALEETMPEVDEEKN